MSNSVFLKPDENGNWGKVGTDASGNASQQLVFQSGATAVGNGTAVDVSGYATLMLRVTISATAQVNFETSVDGTNYNGIVGMAVSTATGSNTSVTNDYRFNIGGVKWFRARIFSYTSGTVDVIGYASPTGTIVTGGAMQSYGFSDANSPALNLQGVGAYNLLFDGTNWQRQRAASQVIDGSNGAPLPTTALMGYNGTTWDRVRSVNTGQIVTTLKSSTGVEPRGDATTDGSSGTGAIAVSNMGWAGATFDRVRVGKVYKYIEFLALGAGASTTVWTPSAGKKFRLMGISVAVGGAGRLIFNDGAAGTPFHAVRINNSDTQSFDFGNGYLSSTVLNVLEVKNTGGAAADVWVTAWGTEE